MGRKKWSKSLVTDVFNKTVFKQKGIHAQCWHCGKIIERDKRTYSDGVGAWHIDHFPVQFADIEDQVCCGVTDQHDITNLVPSCVACNIGHQYEKRHWYYCGHSQMLCTRLCLIHIGIILFISFVIFLAVVLS
tara:strand:+ start:1045 stop:1443 length:399 start_codon:yes stop_codon:yes gene_type:complete